MFAPPPTGSPEAVYLALHRSGELTERADWAGQDLADCSMCANQCHVDRGAAPGLGRCRTGRQALVSSAGPHHGEEAPLSGRRGSGTIFFAGCNLSCAFCQNWQISQQNQGRPVDDRQLAQLMLDLQGAGCHNINFVSPSHVIPQILAALALATAQGLTLPLVYNSGGYDSAAGLALLDGVIDIYMPDMKFADSALARRYLGVADYARVNRNAVREMHRQVGDLQLGSTGLARRGLLVRHLVLPGKLAGTRDVLTFLAREVSTETCLNLMDQYRPCYQADRFPELDRKPSLGEMRTSRKIATQLGLHRLV